MTTPDFFRARLDAMIDLRHPLAVLATRMPWAQIEAALAPCLTRKDRQGRAIEVSISSARRHTWWVRAQVQRDDRACRSG